MKRVRKIITRDAFEPENSQIGLSRRIALRRFHEEVHLLRRWKVGLLINNLTAESNTFAANMHFTRSHKETRHLALFFAAKRTLIDRMRRFPSCPSVHRF